MKKCVLYGFLQYIVRVAMLKKRRGYLQKCGETNMICWSKILPNLNRKMKKTVLGAKIDQRTIHGSNFSA